MQKQPEYGTQGLSPGQLAPLLASEPPHPAVSTLAASQLASSHLKISDPPMLSSDRLFVFDFDGSDRVRCLNRSARALLPAGKSTGTAALDLDAESLGQLRTAAQRSRQLGSASTDLMLGHPPRALAVHVTQSMDTARYLLVAVPQESLNLDRLSRQTAAAMAHHLRNPMAGVRGAVEVIGAELGEDHPELRAVVCQITDRIDALDRSLDSLLAYLHPRPLELRHVDLRALLEEIVAGAGGPVPIRAFSISLSCEEAVLPADSHQVAQAIVDLLANAAEALPAGETNVDVTLTHEPPFASISVTNPGKIHTDLMSRVCEPFFTTKARALGLGLTNARKIARAHGGDLTVTATGNGTQVRLSLPLVEGPPK